MEYQIKEVQQQTKIHIAILLTHTFEYMNSNFVDFLLGLRSQYAYTLMRSNVLPIDKNRTQLVSLSLKNPAVTHCLFIDTDVIPDDKNFLDIMVSYDLSIIGLLCTKKCPPYEPILWKHDAPEEEKKNGFWVGGLGKGLVEVDATGTGCLLVKREVFEVMKEPYFKFISSYDDNIFQSEDVYFLNKAQSRGYKVYVDTEHTCTHLGIYGYGLKDFERSNV